MRLLTPEVKDEEMMERAAVALSVLADILKGKPKVGASGVRPCPICDGDLLWSYGGPRAIRIACKTDGCVAMMS